MPLVEKEILLTNGPPWGFRLFEDENRGLVVHKIRQWSPAQNARLREGDVIRSINGRSTNRLSHLEAVDVIDFTLGQLKLLVGRFESVHSKKVCFNEYEGQIQSNSVTKIQMSLQREPMTTPASPDMTPVPISKLMKEYDIPPRPDVAVKKKRYANSEFFDDDNIHYPTVEEKIKMAKTMADSLTAPVNKMSKGAHIFEKQRERIEKYVKEGPDPEPEIDMLHVVLRDGSVLAVDPPMLEPPPPPPFPPPGFPGHPTEFRKGPPLPPPLPGAPKTLKEYLEKIKTYPKVQHDSIGPEKCFTIASALHNGNDKGAQIFHRNRARSYKWEITNEPRNDVIVVTTTVKKVSKVKIPSKLGERRIDEKYQMKTTKCSVEEPSKWRPVKFKVPSHA